MGLSADDSVFLHSGIKGLGFLRGGITTIKEAFKQTIGNGILMFPTFSYSWCNDEKYDPEKTECKLMGTFGDRIWKEKGFLRSSNPNFSIASTCFGGNEEEIKQLYQVDNTCFGHSSVFGNIYRRSKEKPTYIMLLGGAHDDCVFRCTFIHYVEEVVNVAYRYKKKFFDPEDSSKYVTQYVRFKSEEEFKEIIGINTFEFVFPITADYSQLGNDLISSSIITIKPFGYSETRMVRLDTFCDSLEKGLKKDSNYILKKQ
jgi:aminoglycoside N3'-acetyltransferase